MRIIHYLIATVLGGGYSPIAPGTVGTLFAWIIAFFIFKGDMLALGLAVVISTIVGVLSSDYVERDLGTEDPQIVIVDEVAGMWIGLFLVPVETWLYVVAFALFRFFDIKKPFPINTLQHVHGGWGIMLDDIAAGFYTFIVMQILMYFIQ